MKIWFTIIYHIYFPCNKTKTYISVLALTPLQSQWLYHCHYIAEALLVATNTSQDDTKVLHTDLFSCSPVEKFQNVNKSSATCTGLLSPPSEANFTLYYYLFHKYLISNKTTTGKMLSDKAREGIRNNRHKHRSTYGSKERNREGFIT
jgi:hypothetical protein